MVSPVPRKVQPQGWIDTCFTSIFLPCMAVRLPCFDDAGAVSLSLLCPQGMLRHCLALASSVVGFSCDGLLPYCYGVQHVSLHHLQDGVQHVLHAFYITRGVLHRRVAFAVRCAACLAMMCFAVVGHSAGAWLSR